MPSEPPSGAVDESALWRALTGTHGALRVRGDTVSGWLFAVHGRPYFAVVDGRPPIPADLSSTGIDAAVWRQALASDTAATSLSAALVEAGAPPAAVAAFAADSIRSAIATLAADSNLQIDRHDRHHPFGTEVTLEMLPDRTGPSARRGRIEAEDLLEKVRPSNLGLAPRRTLLGRPAVENRDEVGRSAYDLVSDLRAEQAAKRPRKLLRSRER